MVYYSGLQTGYWISHCLMVTFATIYLQARGYSSSEIGIIMSVGNLMALVIQPFIAAWADRSEKVTVTGIVKVFFSIVGILEVLQYFLEGRCLLMTLTYTVAFCSCVMSQSFITSAVFMAEKKGIKISYAVGRAIGSMTYAIMAAIMGSVVERMGVSVLPATVVGFAVFMIAMTSLFTKGCGVSEIQESSNERNVQASSTLEFLKNNKRFVVLLVGIMMIFYHHSLMYNFTILIVQNLNGTSTDMGRISGFSAMLEVPVMILFDRIIRKRSCTGILKFACLMFTAKALSLYLAPSIPWLYFAVLFQTVSFAIYTPCVVRYAFLSVDRKDEVKAQTFLLLASTTGSIFSSFTGGLLFDGIGVKSTLFVALVVCAIGSVIAFFAVDNKVGKRQEIA